MLPGVVAYRGPSVLDGQPIAVVLTRDSDNRKTGPMSQTWILRTDVHPLHAVREGLDRSICGTCPHRGTAAPGTGFQPVRRTCYVTVQHAPAGVYRALVAGDYADDPDWATVAPDDVVRIGAYGDPAAVPIEVWQRLLARISNWTGYTHLWRTCNPAFREFCMASVDSAAEAFEAKGLGWRTYRARTSHEALAAREITCPASAEAGHRTTCLSCRLCMGTRRPAADIAIVAHGPSQTKFFTGRHQLRLF